MDTHASPFPFSGSSGPSGSASSNEGPDAMFALKALAQTKRIQAGAAGQVLTQGAALEMVARELGFKDWNAVKAAAKADRLVTPTAAASVAPTAPVWFDVSVPLQELKAGFFRAGDQRRITAQELMRWAKQLNFIATVSPVEQRAELLSLIGGETPYVFVRDVARFGDTRFRLCDRAYEPFAGADFSQEELDELNLAAWQDIAGTHDGKTMVTVLSDDFLRGHDTTVLRQGARLLAHIAKAMTSRA